MATTEMRQLLSLTVFVTVFVTPCVRGYAACQLHHQTGDGSLRISETESSSPVEIGYEMQYKELKCKIENYCSIIWKKNNSIIKESQDVMLLDRNQTLKFNKLNKIDDASYTCQATNGKTSVNRTVRLAVVGKDCGQDWRPIAMQQHGCSNDSATIGGSVTFNCKFFVGCHKARGSWVKINKSADENDRFRRELTLDELKGGTIFNTSDYSAGPVSQTGHKSEHGFILKMYNITEDAFGTYKVAVRANGRDSDPVYLELTHALVTSQPLPKPEDWNHYLITPLLAIVVCCVLFGLVWHRCKIDIKLIWKDKFAVIDDDSKSYDVYLSYDWTNEMDRGFAIKLVNRLEESGYSVFWEIHCLPGGVTDEDILQGLETSHRCVIIFSPDYLASHRNLDVIFAMDNAKHYRKEIIPVIFRDISSVTGADQGVLVKRILSTHCLRYDHIQSQPQNKVLKIIDSIFRTLYTENTFQKELLLKLPPRGRSPHPSSLASEVNLVSADIVPIDRSKESIKQHRPSKTIESHSREDLSNGGLYHIAYNSNAVIPQIPYESNLYPDITGVSNGLEVTNI